MKFKSYFFALFGFLLPACHAPADKEDALLQYALDRAGDNRGELATVLRHYAGDSLKAGAARFLIRNLPAKGYLSGAPVDEFHTFIDSVYRIRQEEYDETALYRPYRRQARHSEEPVRYHADLTEIKASDLVRHIDEAFKVWQKPWNRSLTPEEFYEWVLPYRLGNELPENWRPVYRAFFETHLTDSVTGPRDACRILNRQIRQLPIHIFFSSVRPSDIRPSSLLPIKFGLCEDYAALAVFAMRSVGIPVSLGMIPHWGRGNNKHTFNLVYTPDGRGGDFSAGEEDPAEHLVRFEGIPKIYRKTFSIQLASLLMQSGQEKIPPFFQDPCLEDITGRYASVQAQTVSVDLAADFPGKQFAYLCVFDPSGWTPVDWGHITNSRLTEKAEDKSNKERENAASPIGEAVRRVTFQNVGPDIIYQVAVYDKEKLIPLTSPFYVDTLGKQHVFRAGDKRIRLTLERKQKESSNLLYIPPTMVGGKFQGSDEADFRHAEDLYVFTEPPVFKYTTVSVHPAKAYRYYRYLSSADTQGNMAEVEFREARTDTVLGGCVVGTDKTSIYHPEAVKENVFDGDGLTYFHTADSLSWAGLELSSPAAIRRIRYLIRNDDNGVRKGNIYELFYIGSDFAWVSAGRKIAGEDDRIHFDHVPDGTVYWLRNLTRGKEERIFTYKNGQQLWW